MKDDKNVLSYIIKVKKFINKSSFDNSSNFSQISNQIFHEIF